MSEELPDSTRSGGFGVIRGVEAEDGTAWRFQRRHLVAMQVSPSMSDSIALVRFPDGEIRAAYYFGSVDAVIPLLVPLEEAPALLEGGMETLVEQLEDMPESAPDTEPVEVWALGCTFDGLASKSLSLLVDGSDPYGLERSETGNPDAPPAKQIRDVTPDWVRADWRT